MNVLFLTLIDISSLEERTIYTDLLREFRRNGYNIFIISPTERRCGINTHQIQERNCRILKLKTGNMQKTNIIEKGISTVFIEYQFAFAARKYFSSVKFDLILYSTPPITICRVVEYVKNRDRAESYLLLKDIFPQNAVDIGMMSKKGMKGLLYRYFRKKEKRLYKISDKIGCMSEANVRYVLEHNPEVKYRNKEFIRKFGRGIVEVCPNSIEPVDLSISQEERKKLREKYNIPQDKTVFIYGGNLGRPQGISFMLKCLHSQRKNDKVFFLIVGSGTEYFRIERYIQKYRPDNIVLCDVLSKEDYDRLVAACDVGLIFLDHRFTIPNFPSRLLTYMQAKLPVLAVTDLNTDIGKVIMENGFGWWCESDDVSGFRNVVEEMVDCSFNYIGNLGYEYLFEKYTVTKAFDTITT